MNQTKKVTIIIVLLIILSNLWSGLLFNKTKVIHADGITIVFGSNKERLSVDSSIKLQFNDDHYEGCNILIIIRDSKDIVYTILTQVFEELNLKEMKSGFGVVFFDNKGWRLESYYSTDLLSMMLHYSEENKEFYWQSRFTCSKKDFKAIDTTTLGLFIEQP